MPSSANRRRVEIPAGLHARLEEDAKWLYIPLSTYITLLLTSGTGTARSTGVIQLQGRPRPADDPA
jgi:hypothetical protein